MGGATKIFTLLLIICFTELLERIFWLNRVARKIWLDSKVSLPKTVKTKFVHKYLILEQCYFLSCALSHNQSLRKVFFIIYNKVQCHEESFDETKFPDKKSQRFSDETSKRKTERVRLNSDKEEIHKALSFL